MAHTLNFKIYYFVPLFNSVIPRFMSSSQITPWILRRLPVPLRGPPLLAQYCMPWAPAPFSTLNVSYTPLTHSSHTLLSHTPLTHSSNYPNYTLLSYAPLTLLSYTPLTTPITRPLTRPTYTPLSHAPLLPSLTSLSDIASYPNNTRSVTSVRTNLTSLRHCNVPQ